MTVPPLAFVEPDLYALDDRPTDALILAAFSDERPLEGLNGLVDWRLCGALSRWFIQGLATGALGERILYPARRRLSSPRVILFGMGLRAEYRTDRALAVAHAAVEAAVALGARTLTCGLFGLDQLPSPLARTGKELLDTLTGEARLEHVLLVAPPDAQATLRGSDRERRGARQTR